ncbi:hypothetical protein BKA58DRAFT_448101 [Alternaria rosae]|uniref:uncharacterized protein n=1 Tax=Alternaria rosae TaxID=1187941 RepID=UPI001E8D0475|nr:uncharacterized protein BKA58DRAFT_448101 [Alternaria rosae]KAH6883328.1 hypothetical protein BKA58DRAFT_448101 [Alternaria rosae]
MSYGQFKKETDEKRKSIMKDYLASPGPSRLLQSGKTKFSEASTSTVTEDVYKWSYINTEDLVTPTHILQLLNSRGRFTPNRFAETDWQSSELGRNISVIKAHPIHDDPNDESQYKDLFEAEDEGDEREGEIETEKRLRQWKDRHKDSEWAYYMLMDRTNLEACEIPMKIPVALEAVKPWEDHTWAISEWYEHLSVHILDRKGRKDSNFSDPDVHRALWHNTIAMAIKEPYENLAIWKTAFRALNIIIKIVASRAQIQKEVDTCARAVGWLSDFLDLRLITKLAKRLPNLLPGSPPMRGMFIQNAVANPNMRFSVLLAPLREEMQWTPHWVEPAELSNQAKTDAALEEYIMPMIPGQQRDTMDLPIRSEKLKTRGKTNGPSAGPVEVEADLQAVVPEETNTPSTPRFTVGKKTQHTFSTIFFQPSASSHPGDVP